MTPGTGPVRRKTVSFGAHVPPSERDGGHDQAEEVLGNRNIPLIDESPGKHPMPNPPWAEGVDRSKSVDRSKRKKSSDGTGTNRRTDQVGTVPLAASNSKSKNNNDNILANINTNVNSATDTLSLNLPQQHPPQQSRFYSSSNNPESVSYWQSRYRTYADRSTHEVRKLLAKQQSAKQYAKKKDLEATELANKLKDERRRHKIRERALESQVKEGQDRIVVFEGEVQRMEEEIKWLRRRMETLTRSQGQGRNSGADGGNVYEGLGAIPTARSTAVDRTGGNGSKTSSVASGSYRMSSTTTNTTLSSSSNRDFDKFDVVGKNADIPPLPSLSNTASYLPTDGGNMSTVEKENNDGVEGRKASSVLSNSDNETFLHPPSDSETGAPLSSLAKKRRSSVRVGMNKDSDNGSPHINNRNDDKPEDARMLEKTMVQRPRANSPDQWLISTSPATMLGPHDREHVFNDDDLYDNSSLGHCDTNARDGYGALEPFNTFQPPPPSPLRAEPSSFSDGANEQAGTNRPHGEGYRYDEHQSQHQNKPLQQRPGIGDDCIKYKNDYKNRKENTTDDNSNIGDTLDIYNDIGNNTSVMGPTATTADDRYTSRTSSSAKPRKSRPPERLSAAKARLYARRAEKKREDAGRENGTFVADEGA